MVSFIKHENLSFDLSELIGYIISNTPKKKANESTINEKNSEGIMTKYEYTVEDSYGIIHNFSIIPEKNQFKLKYIVINKYQILDKDEIDI